MALASGATIVLAEAERSGDEAESRDEVTGLVGVGDWIGGELELKRK